MDICIYKLFTTFRLVLFVEQIDHIIQYEELLKLIIELSTKE